ncbi:MAG: LiaI-LiaF-like domain-containing protein [Smithellaceae bacterium]
MTENQILNGSMSKGHHCGAMCGGRNSGLFWGVLFIVVGLYWFGKVAGWFPAEMTEMFWPLVFVLTGTGFVVAALTNRRRHRQNK